MYVCDELLAVWFNISFMFLAANIETYTINVCNRIYVMNSWLCGFNITFMFLAANIETDK